MFGKNKMEKFLEKTFDQTFESTIKLLCESILRLNSIYEYQLITDNEYLTANEAEKRKELSDAKKEMDTLQATVDEIRKRKSPLPDDIKKAYTENNAKVDQLNNFIDKIGKAQEMRQKNIAQIKEQTFHLNYLIANRDLMKNGFTTIDLGEDIQFNYVGQFAKDPSKPTTLVLPARTQLVQLSKEEEEKLNAFGD